MDFGEGMKTVLDAVGGALTSSEGEWIPTLLMPWRGAKNQRRSSKHPSLNLSNRVHGGKQ